MRKIQFGSVVKVNKDVDKSYTARVNRIDCVGMVYHIEMDEIEKIEYCDIQFKWNGSEEDRIMQQGRFKMSELTEMGE